MEAKTVQGVGSVGKSRRGGNDLHEHYGSDGAPKDWYLEELTR